MVSVLDKLSQSLFTFSNNKLFLTIGSYLFVIFLVIHIKFIISSTNSKDRNFKQFLLSAELITIILFVYLKNKDLFNFNELFFAKLTKILLASILMGIFFNYLILFFQNKLIYEYNFKSFYLILSAFLSLIFYLSFSLFIKAFKYGDIKLKY